MNPFVDEGHSGWNCTFSALKLVNEFFLSDLQLLASLLCFGYYVRQATNTGKSVILSVVMTFCGKSFQFR